MRPCGCALTRALRTVIPSAPAERFLAGSNFMVAGFPDATEAGYVRQVLRRLGATVLSQIPEYGSGVRLDYVVMGAFDPCLEAAWAATQGAPIVKFEFIEACIMAGRLVS